MWCTVPPQILQNGTLAALVCAAPPDDPSQCIAICPNPDISGVGVRSAFYLQSVMNSKYFVCCIVNDIREPVVKCEAPRSKCKCSCDICRGCSSYTYR